MVLEVCIDSVESALAAQEGGAGRVELCADLDHGGTTPEAGVIRSVRERISIPLHVMIRPRPGDFCYSDRELGIMERDIAQAKMLGVNGVVFGILTEQGDVDVRRTNRLLELARPLAVTFHRAFDESVDLLRALDDLKAAGIDRVLTSGGRGNILGNAGMIGELVRKSEGRPVIMAGGGIDLENASEIVRRSNVTEIHTLSAVLKDDSPVSQSPIPPGTFRTVVDPRKVRRMVQRIGDLPSRSQG
jgi:copper homeostasis protein